MAETVTIEQTVTPEVKPEVKVEVTPEVKETPKESIVTRASKVKLDEKKPDNPFGLTKEDYDKVQADSSLSKLYKSMQSDYVKKTQAISEEKKQVEQALTESKNWSPEKVQSLLNDQKFVQAASQIIKTQAPNDFNGTQQEWSALSEKEKQEIMSLKQEVNSLRLQNSLEQQKRQDESLKTKYANYEPQAVDIITNDLLQGKMQATREHLWKVYDYENAIERAYKLGLEDKKLQDTERSNASSYDGMTMNPPNRAEAPKKEEGNQQAFKRIALENLAKFMGKK